MQRGIAAANANLNPATAGAYVAMDPRNGEVLALGSYPSFDANLFAKPIIPGTFDRLNSEENGAPLFNRAIAATYPTGSTFKPITALAALERGIIDAELDHQLDTGSYRLGNRELQNARGAAFGSIAVAARAQGLLGHLLLHARRAGQPAPGEVIQTGRASSASAGRRASTSPASPTASCRPRVAQRGLRRVPAVREAGQGRGAHDRGAVRVRRHRAAVVDGRQRQPRHRPGRPAGHAAADGGRLLRDRQRRPGGAAAPRAAGRGRRSAARSRRSASPRSGEVAFSADRRSRRSWRACAAPRWRRAARRAAVMAGFPLTVYGKTGTVERVGQPDQSWYVAYVADPRRARSSSRSPSSAAASARRPPRPPRGSSCRSGSIRRRGFLGRTSEDPMSPRPAPRSLALRVGRAA